MKETKVIKKRITKKSNPAPIELLFAVVDKNQTSKVNDLLNAFGEKNTIIVFGHGTVDSEIVELFGFDIIDKALTISIVQRKNSSDLIEMLAKELKLNEEEHTGVVFTVPINSIEKEFFNFLKNSWSESNE